jgi:transcriptional regulator GlxA family with amidase domain
MKDPRYFIVGAGADRLIGKRVPETAVAFESLQELDLWRNEQTGRDVESTIEVDVRAALREIGRPMPDLQGVVLRTMENLCRRNQTPRTVREMIPARVGRRTFYSRWNESIPETPRAFLDRVRLLHARRLIEQESLALKTAAYRSGYGTPRHLRQAILERAGEDARLLTDF